MVSWICLAHSGMSSVWFPYGMVSWLTLCPFCLWNHCSQTGKRHHHSVPKILYALQFVQSYCFELPLLQPLQSLLSAEKISESNTVNIWAHLAYSFSLQSVASIISCLLGTEISKNNIIYICISTYKQKFHCITSVSLKNNIVINSINNIHYTAWSYSMKLKFPSNKINTWVEWN